MFGSLINYWQYTGDTSYNPTVEQALLYQIGPDENYNPPNQSKNMGIDDQAFWAFSAMDAAEANFPAPPKGQPSYLALAQAVFNFQTGYWDPDTCGGGMRWQVYSFNAGWNLKNTISNGGFFQLAARLARYTNNQTYADWATKSWDWMASSPLMTLDSSGAYQIWDNTDANTNCSSVTHYYWTYNFGTMLIGAATLYNWTTGDTQTMWGSRVQQILNGLTTGFFPQQYGGGKVMVEIECEPSGVCNNDEHSFKAYLARWMALTAQLAPFTAGTIIPLLQSSSTAAAGQCVGGNNGRMCGQQWYQSAWDGSSGVGQQVSAFQHLFSPFRNANIGSQMAALSVIGTNLLTPAMVPLTKNTGGNSVSDPNAGTQSPNTQPDATTKPITTSDRAGAGILTFLIIVGVIGGAWWINVE